jgi:hypothetical protein
MKQLFVGLVLLNLLVFGWYGVGPGRLAGNPLAAALAPPPPGVEGLRLLAEGSEPVARSGPTMVFLDPYCFSVGPIPAKSTLRELRDLLSGQGISAEARREEYQEFTGNWVYLPPATDREGARQLVSALTEKGFSDHLIVPSGPKRNAVSLGFFRNETAARDYFKRLQTAGFAPVMEENYRSGLRYWLDFNADQATPLSDAMVRELDSQYEVGVTRNNCDSKSPLG